MVQALLGLPPDAPHRTLYVDPVLPCWLPGPTLRSLRLGEQVFYIRFLRPDEKTRFEVPRGDPACVAPAGRWRCT